MSEKIVTGRASWTLGELIPIILTLGFGLLSLSAVFTEIWVIELARIGMAVGFGLTIYLIIVNWNRKRKSTLFADLKNDDKYSISVWMRKPLKHKWNGKLDRGTNEGALLNTKRVTMVSVLSTRVIVFSLNNDKKIYVPVRLLQENREVRLYLVEAVEALGGKLKFANNDDRQEFESILLGKGKVYVNEKNRYNPAENSTTKPSKPATKQATAPSPAAGAETKIGVVETGWDEETEPEDNSDRTDRDGDGEEETVNPQPATPMSLTPTKVIGYGQYAPKSLNDSIDEAMDLLDRDKETKTRHHDIMPGNNDLLGLGDGNKTTVLIELPAEPDVDAKGDDTPDDNALADNTEPDVDNKK